MFINDVIFYGESAQKIEKLKETGLFERILDVFMVAGLIGLLLNKTKEIEKNEVTKKIFANQLNGELDRLRYFSSLVILVNNSSDMDSKEKEKKVLSEAFGDWFSSDSNSDSEKYKLFLYVFFSRYRYFIR